jgi:hypothetical protein
MLIVQIGSLKESAVLTRLSALLDKDKSAGDAKVYD